MKEQRQTGAGETPVSEARRPELADVLIPLLTFSLSEPQLHSLTHSFNHLTTLFFKRFFLCGSFFKSLY